MQTSHSKVLPKRRPVFRHLPGTLSDPSIQSLLGQITSNGRMSFEAETRLRACGGGRELSIWTHRVVRGRGHLLFEGLQHASLDVIREGLRFGTLVKLPYLLSGVDDCEATGAFANVRLKTALQLHVEVRVQIVVQFLKELFAGKQKRLPLPPVLNGPLRAYTSRPESEMA